MDDLLGPLVAAALVAAIGWLLGIAGFLRAGRALRELASLRADLAERAATPAPDPVPYAQPERAFADPTLPDPAADLPPSPSPSPSGGPVPDGTGPETLPPPLPAPRPPRPKRNWEELLAARWGVWLGAAALVLSAVFLVRYAAEQDLLGPGMRCAAAAAGGLVLLGLAEWLRRRAGGPARLVDYGPGALAAGAVGAWFAAGYMAGLVFGILPPLLTLAVLACVSLAGLALSLRYGALVAAVGVVGAFATPFLVTDGPPPLRPAALYFLFVAGSAMAVVRYTAWAWLGWWTTVACAGLVVLAALGGLAAAPDALWAPALFAPAAALLFVALLPGPALDTRLGRALAYVPVAALGGAALLLAAVAPVAAAKAGVLLVVAVAGAAGAREARLDLLPAAGAVLFLLLLAVWDLPPWDPTDEAVAVGPTVVAVLPGDWTPAALRPLLLTAALGAAAFFAAGLWGERRRPHPLRWSGLAAAVPVLVLGVLFWRVAAFQTGAAWAAAAVLAAAASTAAAVRAAFGQPDREAAGAHAAGATAALALDCGALLSAEWLTLSLSLFVPALALIERSSGLRPLRRVALAVAVLVGARLLLNGAVLADADGQSVWANVLLPAYAVSAAALALGARLFRQGGDDLAVAALELGSAALVAALAVLEVRVSATGGVPASDGWGFPERAADLAALSALSLFALHLRARTGRPAMRWAAGAGATASLLLGAGLLLGNPAFLGGNTGAGRVLNPLLLAYAVPAMCAAAALRHGDLVPRPWRRVLAAYAFLALFAYALLAVRQFFHPGAMALVDEPVEDAESWAMSGACLALGLLAMAGGVVWRSRPLRLAALATVALVAGKVFLFDVAGLGGLWRVLSFGGLGLTLIGLGAIYRRFVAAPEDGSPA